MTYGTLVLIHAVVGGVALLAGGAAAVARKGSRPHVLGGRVFGGAMTFTAVSAVALSIWEPNAFLLGIGLFTGYLVASGWAWIRPAPLSTKILRARIAAAGGILAAAYMILTAVRGSQLAVVLLVFAGFMIVLAGADLARRPDPADTAGRHGGRMGGAYIAAVTAFLVVNLDRFPDLVVWLGPTVVGTPLISRSIRRFRAAGSEHAGDPAEEAGFRRPPG